MTILAGLPFSKVGCGESARTCMNNALPYTVLNIAAAEPPDQRLLRRLRVLLVQWCSIHVRTFLDEWSREQVRNAGHTAHRAESGCEGPAGAEWASHRASIEARMAQHLQEAFNAYLARRPVWDRQAVEARSGSGPFWRVLVGMSRRASFENAAFLHPLQQRLAVLTAVHVVEEQYNPVAPMVFAKLLATGLAESAYDEHRCVPAAVLYEESLMQRLPSLYALLNHLLKRGGILPDLEGSEPARRVCKPPVSLMPPDLQSPQRQCELVERILPWKGAVVAVKPLRTRQAEVLAAGQRRAAEVLQGEPSPERWLAASLDLRRHLEQRHPILIESLPGKLIGKIFDFMLDNEQLPEPVRGLLLHLYGLFLRLAWLDDSFFYHPRHPARQLLNSLVAAGGRWLEPVALQPQSVFQPMHHTVQRMLEQGEPGSVSLIQVVHELHDHLCRHERHVQRAEQQASEAAAGEDRLLECRRQVEQFLQRRCTGIPLTAPARELLLGPWAHYQTFVCLRFGTQSTAWEESIDAVDALLRYVGSSRFRNAAHERLLLAGLRRGLGLVGYAAEEIDRMFVALTETDAPLEIMPIPDVQGEEEALREALAHLEPGSWYRFDADHLPTGEQWKLAWHNPRTLRFLFVNRQGRQASLMSGRELMAGLTAGRVRFLGLLSDVPFFERALQHACETLQPTAAFSASTSV